MENASESPHPSTVSFAELARPAMERMVARVKERAARAGVIPVTNETWPLILAERAKQAAAVADR